MAIIDHNGLKDYHDRFTSRKYAKLFTLYQIHFHFDVYCPFTVGLNQKPREMTDDVKEKCRKVLEAYSLWLHDEELTEESELLHDELQAQYRQKENDFTESLEDLKENVVHESVGYEFELYPEMNTMFKEEDRKTAKHPRCSMLRKKRNSKHLD